MRKMLFLALMLFSAVGAMAQIQFEEGSLKEALAKAKAENKLVMVIGSTTWCGPCKAMAKSVYPLPEVGEYFNKNFVSKKYDLDIADPDKIKDTYKIPAYPTYLFLDGDGVEVARMIGGAKDAPAFIERVTKTTAKENRWAERNERFKNDPSYADEHIQFLLDSRKTKEANECLNELMAKRSVTENYSKSALDTYKKIISSFESPILKNMLAGKKEIAKVMGKKEYEEYLKMLGTNIFFNNGSFNKPEVIETQLAFVKENPAMNSTMIALVAENKESFNAKDWSTFFKAAMTSAPKFTSEEKAMMLWYASNMCKDKEVTKAFGNELIKNEKNAETLKVLQAGVDRIK